MFQEIPHICPINQKIPFLRVNRSSIILLAGEVKGGEGFFEDGEGLVVGWEGGVDEFFEGGTVGGEVVKEAVANEGAA